MSLDPHLLPADLPVPIDDGACDHLHGMRVPAITLPSTSGIDVDLAVVSGGPAVFFFYPRTGVPGQPPSTGYNGEQWEAIAGARGCTPQSCGFRDVFDQFDALGVKVFGVSTSETAHQREFVRRNHIPFDMLSDADLRLTNLLRLPTFRFPVESGGPDTLIRRMAWYVEGATIRKVFYPVFPPDKNAAQVVSWLQRRREQAEKPAQPVSIRSIEPRDRTWVRDELNRFWGDVRVASMGVWHQADELPGYIAEIGADHVGLLTHTPMARRAACEIITLSARLESAGVGTALMHACEKAAREVGCSRLFLTTSNDNMRAMTFYQKLGWRIVAVHPGAIDEARRVTPGIPMVGYRGVPIRDEIELHRTLEQAS